MTSHPRILGLAAALLVLVSLPAQAQFAISARAGSLGPGAELTVGLTQRLNVRAGGTFLPYSRQDVFEDEVDVQITTDARLASGSLLLDFYPFKKVLRLSAGAFYNATQIKAAALPISSYTIDAKEFSAERLGSLEATVDYGSKINPYAGIGFGNAVRGTRLDLLLDIGVLYTDAPRVDLVGTGMIGPTQNHEGSINAGLQEFTLYPVVSLGFGIRI